MKNLIPFKRAVKGICILALLFGIARFCHHQTRGFTLAKITRNLDMAPLFKTAKNAEAEKLLQQKFTYFNRGKQSYAFLSEDGNYVLKIFNNTYQRKLQWLELVHALPFLGSWAEKRICYFQGKIDKTFHSYKIAIEEMPEFSALCCAHLAPTTHLPNKLVIIDPLGIAHTLDPNAMGFLLQKRVDLVYPFLKEKIATGQIEEAQSALSSLIDLFFWKYRHAIADNDPLIRTNYGFLSGKAIQIDVGPLSIDNSFLIKELQRTESARVTASLKAWLQENGPGLIPFLDRELDRQLSWGDATTSQTPL